VDSKKNLNQQFRSLDWRPGLGKVDQKVAKTCPSYDVTHREP